MLKKIVKQRIEETFSRLERDSSLMAIPLENLQRFKDEKYLCPTYIKQWEEVVQLPLHEIRALMLGDDEKGEILRSTSIFYRL